MSNKKVEATLTVDISKLKPLTDEQKEWGLRGALEAIDTLLKKGINGQEIKKLRNSVENQLLMLVKN